MLNKSYYYFIVQLINLKILSWFYLAIQFEYLVYRYIISYPNVNLKLIISLIKVNFKFQIHKFFISIIFIYFLISSSLISDNKI